MAGLLDFLQGASKGFWAGNLGAPVDMAALAANGLIAAGGYAGHRLGLLQTPPGLIEKPVGGSEWIADKMRGVGLLQDNPGSAADAYGQVAGGLLWPVVAAKSPQIAGGLLQAADNLAAPTQLNKQAGVIKATGYFQKSQKLPQDIDANVVRPVYKSLPDSNKYDAAGRAYGDMDLALFKMQNGDFGVKYSPIQGGKPVKPFYAVGDNIDELVDYGLGRISRGQKSSSAAAKKHYKLSLLGRLEDAGIDPNDFVHKMSERSKSEYLTHVPTGTKIRISDHDLPLGYESPDLDLRLSQSTQDQAQAIIDFFGK